MSEEFYGPVNGLQCIDIQRTIDELGVDPRKLTKGSQKRVFAFCASCNETQEVFFFCAIIPNRKCRICASKNRNPDIFKKIAKANTGKKRSPETLKRMSEVARKENLSEETLRKMSEVHKKENLSEETLRKMREVKLGKKMSPASLKKLSESKKRENLSEETRRKMSLAQSGRKASPETIAKRSGKNSSRYGKAAPHGKGAWYIKKDGSKIYLKSSWEIIYAKYLDQKEIEWQYEAKAFEIVYDFKGNKKEGTIMPDFLIDGNWFEVKGWWRDDAQPKFEAFLDQYPEENITLLMGGDLINLGIEIKELSQKRRNQFGQDFIDNHRANKKLAA